MDALLKSARRRHVTLNDMFMTGIARVCDRAGLAALFEQQGGLLLDNAWIRDRLAAAAKWGYENDLAVITTKILGRIRNERAGGHPVPEFPADTSDS